MCITERLTKKYHFYAQYHRNFGNKLIHFICIPSICFSLFVFLFISMWCISALLKYQNISIPPLFSASIGLIFSATIGSAGRWRFSPPPFRGRTMPHRLRFQDKPSTMYFVTDRCFQGRFLLRPSPKANAIIIGVLAHA